MSIILLKNAVAFQKERKILEQIDIDIKKGEFVYLIGKTGSGKSTLLKVLYGALPLQSGFGQIVNISLKNIERKQVLALRKKLGIVFQDFKLLMDRNVFENLEFVLKATGSKDQAKIQEKIEDVLEKVDMLQYIDQMPHRLSGGELQRIVIARALLNNPKLILADEPTGNLDPNTSDEIMELLLHLNQTKQVAILFATHDYRLLDKFPNRILECSEGTVSESKLFA